MERETHKEFPGGTTSKGTPCSRGFGWFLGAWMLAIGSSGWNVGFLGPWICGLNIGYPQVFHLPFLNGHVKDVEDIFRTPFCNCSPLSLFCPLFTPYMGNFAA